MGSSQYKRLFGMIIMVVGGLVVWAIFCKVAVVNEMYGAAHWFGENVKEIQSLDSNNCIGGYSVLMNGSGALVTGGMGIVMDILFVYLPLVVAVLLLIPAAAGYLLIRKDTVHSYLGIYKFLMILDYIGISILFMVILFMMSLIYSMAGWGLTMVGIIVEGYLLFTVVYGVKAVTCLKA